MRGLYGLGSLSEDASKIATAAGEGLVKVVQAVKGQPATGTAPPPVREQGSGTNWTPYILGAGAVLGALWVWKKYGKK